MKHKTILVAIILIIYTMMRVQSQTEKKPLNEEIDIIRVNGITYSGDRIFGIHLNKEEAIQITMKLMDEKNKHDDQLKEVKISAETVNKEEGFLVFEQFKGSSAKGYWKIPKEEFEKLTSREKKALLGKSSFVKDKN